MGRREEEEGTERGEAVCDYCPVETVVVKSGHVMVMQVSV